MRSYIQTIMVMILISCGNDQTTFQSGKVNPDLTPLERAIKTQRQAEAMGIVSLKFQAGEVRQHQVDFDPKLALLDSQIDLAKEGPTTETIIQTSRERYLEEYTQGYDGEEITESFDVTEAGKLDILITVDDSQTMEPIQSKLREALPNLLTYLDNVNWQIAVNTTSSPCLQQNTAGTKLITREMFDQNANETVEIFKNLVLVGTTGQTIERGILMATDGLRGYCEGDTNPWRREDAQPIVLIVSDENNCGSAVNDGCPGQPYLKSSYMTDAISDVRVFGILLQEQSPTHPDCSEIGGYDNFDPINYKQLIEKTNGFFDTICQDNYNTLLQNISRDVSDQTVRKYALKHSPEDTPLLSIDGIDLNAGYTVNNGIITLNIDVPLTAKTLKATYKYGAIPRFDGVNLNKIPDERTLSVQVGSRTLEPNEFTYIAKNNSINFNSRPNDKSRVLIGFRCNSALPDKFVFDSSVAIKQTLSLSVNGIEVQADEATWDHEMGRVTISPPPIDESIVTIAYEKFGDRKTAYDLPKVDPNKIEDVWAIDNQSLVRIPVTIENNKLILPWEEVSNGRKVVVKYNIIYTGDDLKFNIPLISEALEKKVRIKTSLLQDVCQVDDVAKAEVKVSCLEDDFGIIHATYEYSYNYTNSFDLSIKPEDFSQFRAYVEKEEITDFKVSKNGVLTIPEQLVPLGSGVRVLLIP